MRHARWTLVPLFLTLLLVTTCAWALPARASGAEIPSSPALNALLVAVRQTLAQPAAFRVRLTGGSLLGAGATTVTGGGAFDFQAQRGEVALASAEPGRTAEAIFTPRVLYVRSRSPIGFLPPGRTWLAIDFANQAALARNFPQIADQAGAVDPDLALRQLLWGAVSTEGSSSAVLGGQPVRRLNVTVDLARALRNVSGPSRDAYAAALESELAALEGEGGSAASQIAAHAFVTSQGQLLGLELVVPGAAAGGVSMTFGDAGIAVHAVPPPAGKVADLAAITPSGERENQNGGDTDGG
jgi:hypothetical protein